MAVLFVDSTGYEVMRRAHPEAEDAHGTPAPDDPAAATVKGPYPGATVDRGDTTYGVRLDPTAWPVDPDDIITGGPYGDLVTVTSRLHTNAEDPAVDYVGVTAVRRSPILR